MKYHNGRSMTCGHCGGMILATNVAINPKHVYHIGQKFQCLECRVSAVWTNSVRNPKNFLDWLDGRAEKYTNGFCNDQFCVYCGGHIQPLKNGFEAFGKRWDRYGCPRCEKNQHILVNGWAKHEEGDTDWIVNWYKRHKAEVGQAVKQGH